MKRQARSLLFSYVSYYSIICVSLQSNLMNMGTLMFRYKLEQILCSFVILSSNLKCCLLFPMEIGIRFERGKIWFFKHNAERACFLYPCWSIKLKVVPGMCLLTGFAL